MKSKLVFLFGGGIDSVAQVILLNKMIRDNGQTPDIFLLHINYGQRAWENEYASGERLVERGYANDIRSVRIDSITNKNNPLFTDIYEDKHQEYDKSQCMIEFRNAMIGNLGLFVILNDDEFKSYRDADLCFGFYAYTEKGAWPFPDETPEFVRAMNQLADIYGYSNRFIAPFHNIGKREIWKQAYEYDNDLFTIAWTCYEDNEKHCGRCPHCLYLKKFMKEELGLDENRIREFFIV